MANRGNSMLREIRPALLVVLGALTIAGIGCQGCQGGVVTPGDGGLGDGGYSDVGADTFGADSGGPQSDTSTTSGGGDVDASCPGPVCDGTCCGSSQECVDGTCLPACSGTRCGANKTKCCTGDTVCLGEECVQPGDKCSRTEECKVDEICEPTLGRCVPRDSVEVCEYRPPEGKFQPEVACNWSPASGDPKPNRGETEAAPTVANVTDDNGDGTVDTKDIPELIFLSDDHSDGCCNNPSTIRIVRGECNGDGSMDTLGSISQPVTESSGGIAVGDLTGNGVPEIVGITRINGNEEGTAAWTQKPPYDGSDWKVLWHNKDYPTHGKHTNGGAVISIADLEADGTPDIVVGNVALDGSNGNLKWDGYAKTNGNGGVGNNAFLGPSSAVADVDLDGNREVAAGNTLYDYDGTPLWTYNYQSSNSPCGGGLPCDGFNGFADFDKDDKGEVVIIRLGIVYIIHHDGSLMWKHEILKDDCAENESGPPTVADFDGDGEPEIGTAAADFYTVLDPECDQNPVPNKCRQKGVLWATPNQDCSSRVTASSVFDFEGDGKAEMVYADEDNFYIMDGQTGQILFKDGDRGSNTRIEMPLVADIDNDGNSEVAVPSPYGKNKGISVYADTDDNWVRTRRIWNQHGYSVTNVEEDGTIPTQPKPNWSNGRLNNWRQNQQPAGVFDAPDLQVTDIEVGGVTCTGDRDATIDVTVKNDGALGVAPGMPVVLTATQQGNTRPIGRKQTTARLLPGQTETLTFQWTIPQGWVQSGFKLAAEIDPKNDVNECKEMNNTLEVNSKDVIQVAPPPLDVTSLSTKTSNCAQTGKIQIDLTVENVSSGQTIQKGVPIVVEAEEGGMRYSVKTVKTSSALSPGETESFSFDWNVDSALVNDKFDIVAEVDPNQTVLQCENTNRATTTSSCMVGG